MGLTAILRGVAAMLIVVGLAMAPPFILALTGGEPIASGFAVGAVLSLLTGGAFYAASTGRRPPSDFRSALIIILAWWVFVPLFAAIPFAKNIAAFGDAYFEAIAAITTTGGWLSVEGALQSPAGLLWRAELQWMGGLASLAIAAAIFIRPTFIGIDTVLPPFSRGERDSYLRPLRNAIGAFVGVYTVITLTAFSAISLAGAPVYDAVIMALSAPATGGMVPHSDGLAGYAAAVTPVLYGLAILGGANFVVIARYLRGTKGRARDIESRTYFAMLVGIGLLFVFVAGAYTVDGALAQFMNAASFLTTNGFVAGEPPPIIVAMITAMIGGAAVSTAGGFKVLRWLVIMRRAREEIRRLALPGAVFGKRKIGNEFGVWMHFLVFTLTLAVLVVALSVGGYEFELATAAAVAAISNTGPLVTLAQGGEVGFAVFDKPLRWMLAAAMILGRLEAAVALALVNRAFWRS